MKLLKLLFWKIARLFKKKKLDSTEQTHWVHHIYDTTFPAHKAAAGGWVNVHGFKEGSEGNWIYWVGFDHRSFGIRVQDEVIKCKTEEMYDKYIGYGPNNWEIHNAMKRDPKLNTRSGDEVETEFIFRWGDEDKSFNVRFSLDQYGEEK